MKIAAVAATTDRQTDRQAGRQTDRQTGRQTGRQTDTDRHGQTDRETDRQTDKPVADMVHELQALQRSMDVVYMAQAVLQINRWTQSQTHCQTIRVAYSLQRRKPTDARDFTICPMLCYSNEADNK